MAADEVFASRSAGIPSEGVKDQYADGKAARIWKKFVGDGNERIGKYKDFLIGLLKTHNCVTILDAACGTGIAIMAREGDRDLDGKIGDKKLREREGGNME
ncbi:Glycine N-methyltransferase [Eumeta japonica]|uniref:Glycine N-methyltransferase n=1 Tax=Eumeta variegata TaxID=151549 RepID=A0A4C1SML7_EUMVA|nr:Glycine N-methyltransferase [Eumeta japonica]